MFNTLTRIAGIAVLGGAAIFAGLALNKDRVKTDSPPDTSVTAITAQPTNNPQTANTAPLPEASDDSDLFRADNLAQAETPTTSTAERLARLGTGGVLGESADASMVQRALSEVDPENAGFSTRTILRDLENGGRNSIDNDIDNDLANETGTRVGAIAESATENKAQTAAQLAMAETQPGLRGIPNQANTKDTGKSTISDTSSANPDTVVSPASPAVAPVQMTRNIVRADKVDDGKSFSTATAPANAQNTDKADNGKFFTANATDADKPDDGTYFTAQDSGALFNPCMKADGTPYIGPGTSLDPFAAASPCLPQATAESFDIADAGLPTATDSDSTPDPVRRPVKLPDPRTPFPPLGPLFDSDYSSL